MSQYCSYIETPIGQLEIRADKLAILSVLFVEEREDEVEENDLSKKAAIQLKEYFEKNRTRFDLPIILDGSSFQQDIWNMVSKIDYGKTTSYSKIAESINNEGSVRAIGSANGKNKLAIIIPCHRVIGAKGSLTGYAWGLWRKEWLLKHEGAIKQTNLFE